jgi:hypothetical protein
MTEKKPRLVDRVAAKATTNKTQQRGEGRAAFLVHKAEIEEALLAGWTVRNVWETLHDEGKISISYVAFTTYVRRYLPAVKAAPKAEAVRPKAPPKSSGFSIQSVPNKEDIV